MKPSRLPRKPRKIRKTVSRKRTLSKIKKELEALQKKLVIKIFGNDCYTCPQKNLEGANCQLGHVPWPRSDLGPMAKFDTRYTRIQCFRCNINLGGNGAKAYERMQKGHIDLDYLRKESDKQKGKPVKISWYENKIAEYKKELNEK
jgi:hypothetical protein